MTESSGREVLVFKYRRGRQEVRKKYACMQPVFLFFSPPLLPLVSMALKMVVAAIVPLSFCQQKCGTYLSMMNCKSGRLRRLSSWWVCIFSVQEKWRKERGKPFQPPRLYLPVAKTLTHVILIDSILPFFWHHVLPKNRASFIPVKCLNNFKADLMADWELTV